jgi:hypothetical protein
MANPTTNYGFVLPTATDLVTDLPADFDVALQGVDTRLKALQPGTTLGDIAYSSATANTNTRLGIGTSGQVLAVSGGGVPAWTTTADVTPLTTKGDLFTFTTVDARIGVGANGTVLTADSAEATGLKWATASGSTLTVAEIATGTLSGASVTISSLSTYDQLFIQLRNVDMSSVTGMGIRINNNSGSGNYIWNGFSVTPSQTTGNTQAVDDTKFMPFYQGNLPSSAQDNDSGFTLTNCKSAGFTNASWTSAYKNSNTYLMAEGAQGIYKVAEAVSSLVFVANSGTFDGGTYKIWGA